MTREEAITLIQEERLRQSGLWSRPHDWGFGDCSSRTVPDVAKSAILAEECGEVARAVIDRNTNDLRTELVQVAAVALAWLESMPP